MDAKLRTGRPHLLEWPTSRQGAARESLCLREMRRLVLPLPSCEGGASTCERAPRSPRHARALPEGREVQGRVWTRTGEGRGGLGQGRGFGSRVRGWPWGLGSV